MSDPNQKQPVKQATPEEWVISAIVFYHPKGGIQGLDVWDATSPNQPHSHITCEEHTNHVTLIYSAGPVRNSRDVSKTQCDIVRVTRSTYDAWKAKQPGGR